MEDSGVHPGSEACADDGREGAPTKGPMRRLCDEIGFPWDQRLERVDVLAAFIGELVDEVEHLRFVQSRVGELGGSAPSEGSEEALWFSAHMLDTTDRAELISRAKTLHDACDRLNPEEAYPTDHLIDMLQSCASAIRFGLEIPCRSRHTASAAQHVWKQIYGVSRFDGCTPAWERDWARQKLIGALISLLPSSGEAVAAQTAGDKSRADPSPNPTQPTLKGE